MKNENEKKGLFAKLIDLKKPKQNSCCSFELEEIPEDEKEKGTDKNSKDKDGNSCC
ncbi:MAG TPA: hypothetical protein P5273_10600 [Syntrophomonadaceae bacterium]|nr:hypothetical protein [Syntrophomonadaceae bacterium]